MKKKLLLFLPILLLLLTSCAAQQENAEQTSANAETTAGSATEEPSISGLVIAISDLTEGISYIDYDSDGVPMQLLAHIDSNGVPRLAYNTCQVCAGSPYAYFADQNGTLVCQNCHNAFAYDVIGQQGYGCMPIALTEYTIDGDQLIVSADTLAAMQSAFKNWKKGL